MEDNRLYKVMTDNATSAKVTMKMVRRDVFWRNCAAHANDPILEDIRKMPK